MTLILKDPASVLDYRVDWGSRYLAEDGLVESNWSVVPTENEGLTIDGTSFDVDSASVTVSGGRPGKIYRLLNQIATGAGREDSRSILIRVENR